MAKTPAKKRPMITPGGQEITSMREAFGHRMEREGRYKEWMAEIKRLMEERKTTYGKVVWDSMRNLGYTDPDVERQMFHDWVDSVGQNKATQQRRAEQEEIKQEQKVETYESVLTSLPETHANGRLELDWIRSHPAMSRKVRTGKADIEVTLADLQHNPTHPGRTRAAVNALIYWVNHVADFHKSWIGEQRKAKSEGEASQYSETEADFADIQSLLKSAQPQEPVDADLKP